VLPSGYAPTYYPGLPSASGARPIAVGLGQEIEDIDFALARAGTARISGTIVDATGKPLATGITASTSQRSGGLSGEPLRAMSRADGTFEIPNVPPGEWVLQAISGANMNAGQEGEFASRFVTVHGVDVTDVHLQTSRGSRVDGRIVFEGGRPADPTQVVVGTVPSDFDRAPIGGPIGRAIPAADGTFVLEGLNGPRRFRLLRAPGP